MIQTITFPDFEDSIADAVESLLKKSLLDDKTQSPGKEISTKLTSVVVKLSSPSKSQKMVSDYRKKQKRDLQSQNKP